MGETAVQHDIATAVENIGGVVNETAMDCCTATAVGITAVGITAADLGGRTHDHGTR